MSKKRDPAGRIRIGVSTCLLGEKVRYDAGHKHQRYVTDVLGRFFDFVPVCPEADLGMGVPREPIHLEGDPAAPRLIGNTSGEDWTARMNRWAGRRARELERQDISGYLLKSRSPSCGLEKVQITDGKGRQRPKGRGVHALALTGRLPMLPVEEGGRLDDLRLRENWIVRVFAYHRLREFFAGRFARGAVAEFHGRHEFLLMVHSRKRCTSLGRLVAEIKRHRPSEFRDRYCREFMAALQVGTTTKKNVDVLRHIAGHFRDRLDTPEKRQLHEAVERYRDELVPLVVPLTLINLFVHKYEVEAIGRQWYLEPDPAELLLRNHV